MNQTIVQEKVQQAIGILKGVGHRYVAYVRQGNHSWR